MQTHIDHQTLNTYNDEEDEIDEVVEGVGIHDIVHDLHPAFQCDHLHTAHGSAQSRGEELRAGTTSASQ